MKVDAKKTEVSDCVKKLRVDEFKELGFDVAWQLNENITSDEIDVFIDKFFLMRSFNLMV